MSKLVVKFNPGNTRIEAAEGSSLLEIVRLAGYSLSSECGGLGTCGRCKVRLISGQVFLTGELDLTLEERSQGYILACLARIIENIEVEIPPESEFSFTLSASDTAIKPIEHPGAELQARSIPLSPLIQINEIQVLPATPQNNASDYERLGVALIKDGITETLDISLDCLRRLGRTLRENDGAVEALTYQEAQTTKVLKVSSKPHSDILGLALDIGTTTVFARLIDLNNGEIRSEASEYNRQIPCGGDIIHRIVYSGKKDGLAQLQSLVLQSCNGLISELLQQSAVQPDNIVAVCVAGNTTMQHLMLGIDPQTIREEPYVPAVTHFPTFSAVEVGLDILPQAPVFFSPSVASYVGGDITAGILAADMHNSDRLTLYVDLGTNGEIVLGNREWLTACACSAGPAFEGSGVKCGMRAVPGAIDQVSRNAETGELAFRVISGGTPKGICGSGMIDLLAELRSSSRLDARGKLKPEADARRIRRVGRKGEILLIDRAETGGSGDVVVTEVDLDNLIRTKGAIFAGIRTLLKGVGLPVADIERVVIAGGFGRYLDVENAVRIGMLPDLPRDRFEYIGNGSLRGAGLALLSRQLWEELHDISLKITYFELSSWPGYMDEFMAALFLPHTDIGLFPSVR